jgi:hypothetical protein
MRRPFRPTRTPAKLSESVHQRLNMYALAASAGGMSLLTLAQPADAKIVYTPADTIIPPGAMLNLDLNRDGIADFQISNYYYGDGVYKDRLKVLGQRQNNAIRGIGSSASALRAGARIGPNKRFQSGSNLLAKVLLHCDSSCHQRSADDG